MPYTYTPVSTNIAVVAEKIGIFHVYVSSPEGVYIHLFWLFSQCTILKVPSFCRDREIIKMDVHVASRFCGNIMHCVGLVAYEAIKPLKNRPK